MKKKKNKIDWKQKSYTEHSASRLFMELTNAEMAYLMVGTPYKTYLRRSANKYLGQTRKELLRIASMDEHIPDFMEAFLATLHNFNENEQSNSNAAPGFREISDTTQT